MNIYKEMWSLALKLDQMNSNGNYNVDELINGLKFQIEQLSFFYDVLVAKQGNGDASKTYYKLKNRPSEHQLIYVNLTRGFPKELYDAHYCYILKDCGNKFIVIPTTSIIGKDIQCNPDFEMDIEIIDGDPCRLNIDDIRVIDFMRIIQYKNYFNVKTDRKNILDFVNTFFNIKIDKDK